MGRDEHSISSPSKKDVFPHQQYLTQHSNSTLIDFSHRITRASHNTSTFKTHHRHHSDTLCQSLTYSHYYQLGFLALSQTHHYFPLCDWMRQMQRATSCVNHSLQIRSQLFDHIAILFLALPDVYFYPDVVNQLASVDCKDIDWNHSCCF